MSYQQFSEAYFEKVARRECAVLLRAAAAAFSPPDALDALILAAFSQGAKWALDVEAIREGIRG